MKICSIKKFAYQTLLQKLVKHKGHEGTQRKISSFSTVVYFVSFVVKGLFAVDSYQQTGFINVRVYLLSVLN